MYLAFLALAAAVVLHGARTWALDAERAADAQILDRATDQRLMALELGHRASMLAQQMGPPEVQAQALSALLSASASQALEMEAGLAEQFRRSPEAARRASQALEHWQAAREALWYRGQALLNSLGGDPASAVHQAALRLQAASEPAAAAAQALSSRLREAAEDRAARLNQELLWSLGALAVLLGVLSLVVVEPTARAVSRQLLLQREQAAEVKRLALVAEHTTAMVLITDAEDRIQWANAAFTQMTGWRLAEVLGMRPGEFLHASAADPAAVARLRDAVVRGAGLRQEWLNRTRAGRDLWLDVDLRPLRDEGGRLTGFISVSSDVTARVLQQGKLQALWNALPAGVVVRGPDHKVTDANRAAERMVGLSLAQMQGLEPRSPLWRVLHEDLSDYPLDEHPAVRTLATGESVRNEALGLRLPDGELRWLLINTEAQRDATGVVVGVVSCFTDITDRRRLQDQLSHHARTDALTQLPNRSAVMERLQRAIGHASRYPGYGFALLFMDFDRFKQVNDTLGHAAGDELLRQIALRLQKALRPGDALARLEPDDGPRQEVAARIGGDEFVVVLEGVNNAEAVKAIASRLLHELGEPYLIGTAPLKSSVSIGVVLHLGGEGQPPTAEDVLRNADTAMYEAKRAGRGRWVMFDDSMHERVVRALAIESDLRRALKEDELLVVYQPVVDLATRSVTGVEALVRWRHPQRGLVPPMEFIGVAEESGLIDEIGAVVLQKSCAQFMQWRRTLGARAPALLAVNLSRAQLKRPGLVDEMRQLLTAAGMEPAWLQLEITESLAAQDEPVQGTLRELKALGVKLALDDFGTGYSSLACLHQMPVDTVKVDRSFVIHAQTGEYHRVLIEATVRVAHTLGMTTVAEGIETEGQAALMLDLQCGRGQGYLFSRPLEARALESWLADRASRQPALAKDQPPALA